MRKVQCRDDCELCDKKNVPIWADGNGHNSLCYTCYKKVTDTTPTYVAAHGRKPMSARELAEKYGMKQLSPAQIRINLFVAGLRYGSA